MGLFSRKKEELPEKWKKLTVKTKEEVMEAIEIAYNNKEHLDSNIYVGKTKYGNICLCLDENGRIENAFPVLTDREDYISKKSRIKDIGLGEPDDLHLQVVSLLFAIDLFNNKEIIALQINNLPKTFRGDLFEFYIDEELTVISMKLGKIVINTSYIKNFVINNTI